jgi:hypothetical protein
LWGLPPLIDFVRDQAFSDDYHEPVFSTLLGFSPAGTFAAIWLDMGVTTAAGLLGQLAITLILSIASWRVAKHCWARETPQEDPELENIPSQGAG